MRRFSVVATVSLGILLVGCSSAPKPEAADAKKSEPAAPAPEPAAAPAPAAATPETAPAAAAAPVAAAVKLTTDEQKTVYAVGLSMSRQLSSFFDLSPAEIEIVRQAISDGAAGKPAIEMATWEPKIETLARARSEARVPKEKVRGKEYADKAATQKGAVRTPSGLVYRDLTVGTGASPKASDKVKVNYRGTLLNGTEFDSSYKRKEPIEFPLSGVIPCWTEGVQKMKIGGKAQLVCPSDIAYRDQGSPPLISGGATLIFEVELLAIN
ncbi:MAG: FKBP-type peptidyl-prolyl cis-trans isomerase [Acidobacteriota bacterium]